MWMFNGYGMGIAGWFLMAAFWIALVALILFAVMRLFPGRSGAADDPYERVEEPREILGRRLAKGEIDVETYERLSSKLGPASLAGRG